VPSLLVKGGEKGKDRGGFKPENEGKKKKGDTAALIAGQTTRKKENDRSASSVGRGEKEGFANRQCGHEKKEGKR